MLPKVIIAGSARETMRRAACAAYPREGGGLLLGACSAGAIVVAEARPVRNLAAGSADARFRLHAEEVLGVERDARARMLDVVGVFHSHPDAPAIPSREDAESALPGLLCAIVGVRGGRAVSLAAWWPTFDGLEALVLEPAPGDPAALTTGREPEDHPVVVFRAAGPGFISALPRAREPLCSGREDPA